MQGSVDNFFKAFDELKRKHNNVEMNLRYTSFWMLEILISGKVIMNIKGNETNKVFDIAAGKLLNFLRSK